MITHKQFVEQTEKKRRASMVWLEYKGEKYLVPVDTKFADASDWIYSFIAYREEGDKIIYCDRFYENIWMDDWSIPNTQANREFLEKGHWCDPSINWVE